MVMESEMVAAILKVVCGSLAAENPFQFPYQMFHGSHRTIRPTEFALFPGFMVNHTN